MPVALHEPLTGVEIEAVALKRWTREEVDRLVELELIDPRRYELIEGELVEKVPKNLPHMRVLALLCDWLKVVFGPLHALQEPSIHLAPQDTPYSDPEPDAVVLTRTIEEFTEKPNPGDILLVVEVSHTTLGIDTTRKAALYARAGIADYWVLDIKGRRMIVHREPQAGAYLSITAYAADEPVSPLAAPSASASAAQFL